MSPEPIELVPSPAPPSGTLERWAWDYLHATELSHKLTLAPPPRVFEPSPPARPHLRPARPAALVTSTRAPRTPGPEALRSPLRRAQLVHTFLHHELQAAELMCWALLAFPSAPEAFRLGLAAIARDEVRHMAMYDDYLRALGHPYGTFPVRDWFWERVPGAASPAHFVATLGLGFEGANLDHTRRFAARLRAAGDARGAALQAQVGAEEIPHVRFARVWFRRFTGRDDFATWRAHIVPPLSPLVMRGAPLDREARGRAGQAAGFLDELERWRDDARGC